nr:carbohydrate kinase family protein [Clostridia bacterium]
AFDKGDVPDGITAKIYHIAGLVYGDYTDAFLGEIAGLGGKFALDVQCMLRHRSPDGSLYFEDWADKKEWLPRIDLLKTDAAEAEILTGLTDRYKAAELLCSWGAREVMITHNDEVIVCNGSETYACPIRSRSLAGRTGRGDTCFGAYIAERLDHGMESSLLTATAAVSLKMEKAGKFSATREELDEYIRLLYADLKN